MPFTLGLQFFNPILEPLPKVLAFAFWMLIIALFFDVAGSRAIGAEISRVFLPIFLV